VPHYRVTLAYDGTDFAGWQSQAAGRGRTVQGVLEEGLARLAGGGGLPGARVKVVAAGRTDAGVHALGQVACFRLEREWPPADLVRALNGVLPVDARALRVAVVDEGFHARRSALSKVYRYTLDTHPLQLPTRRLYAGHSPFALDRDKVAAVAALYLGRHDFASLASAGSSVTTTERTVRRSEARWEGDTLVYEVEADGFLRKMVRSMVGGLVAAGRGTHDLAAFTEALRARDRREWPPPAPARGLVLVRVNYAGEAERDWGREARRLEGDAGEGGSSDRKRGNGAPGDR
jgi:tRNA pseudouridine38-40 synthase